MFASLHTSTLAVAHVQSRGTLADLVKRFRLAMTARRQRAQLARLDDAMLADIGVSPRQAATEAARPAWDVPSNWLR
ncbi:MAG: DUF1127 domain-containing protein [Pseudomonadota bacterium]